MNPGRIIYDDGNGNPEGWVPRTLDSGDFDRVAAIVQDEVGTPVPRIPMIVDNHFVILEPPAKRFRQTFHKAIRPCDNDDPPRIIAAIGRTYGIQ